MAKPSRLLGLCVVLFAASAVGQVLVVPRHAGKSPLRTFKNEWMSVDLAIAPSKARSTAGRVQLYFDRNEREMAERAAAAIERAYRRLIDEFHYVPDRSFTYVLYSSYPEFLETNLFPLQEGTLGVTSPLDLKLTLPYLGDDRLFEEVGTHELAHQFTIQKLRALGGGDVDLLQLFPLWFIEGLAEFYARGGLDPEAEVLLRDLVVNPDPAKGHVLPGFFEEARPSYLTIYKLGQARCVFLEETYGEGALQRILEGARPVVASTFRPGAGPVPPFERILQRVSGDEPRTIAQKFEAWMKRRAYRSYLGSGQDLSISSFVPDLPGMVLSLSASPGGELLMVKTLEPLTGQTRLLLMDPKGPGRGKTVVADGVPGYDSLHPIAGRSFDLGRSHLVFVAERSGRDVVHLQGYERKAAGAAPRLSSRRSFAMRDRGLVGVMSVALSPDERRLALVGLDGAGQRDVYVFDPQGEGTLTRLTHDEFAEREVSWGPQGVVFTADATVDRHFNLFLVDPDAPAAPVRLTAEPRDHENPRALPDGRVLFVAHEDARANLFEAKEGRILRRTDVATGVLAPSPGPDGGLWVLWLDGGALRPALLDPRDLGEVAATVNGEARAPAPLARRSLEGAQPYRPLSPSSWELGPVFGLVGGGSGGVAGQLFAVATDRLRDHALVLNAAAFGSLRLSEGLLLYLNQERRVSYGFGLFQLLRFRLDSTFPELPVLFLSVERFRGGLGAVRYPFSQYVFAEAELAVGVNERFLQDPERAFLAEAEFNRTGNLLPDWEAQNRGAPLQVEPTVRVGFDTLRHHLFSGPIAGSSVLLELTGGFQPSRQQAYQRARLDAEHVFPLAGRFRFHARTGAGVTRGDELATGFYLSSYDTLRGVPFGDSAWLLGRHYVFATGELRAPLDPLIRILIIPTLEALAGVDAGGVADSLDGLWSRRVLDLVLGLDFSLGPFLLRFHFARPIDTGAPAGLPVAPGAWVPNFSIRVLGLPGWVFGAAGPQPGTPRARRP